MQPVMIDEPSKAQLKIGFVAKQKILQGEELFFDYGIKYNPELPWLATDANKVGTTLQNIGATTSTSPKSKSPFLTMPAFTPIYSVTLSHLFKN